MEAETKRITELYKEAKEHFKQFSNLITYEDNYALKEVFKSMSSFLDYSENEDEEEEEYAERLKRFIKKFRGGLKKEEKKLMEASKELDQVEFILADEAWEKSEKELVSLTHERLIKELVESRDRLRYISESCSKTRQTIEKCLNSLEDGED